MRHEVTTVIAALLAASVAHAQGPPPGSQVGGSQGSGSATMDFGSAGSGSLDDTGGSLLWPPSTQENQTWNFDWSSSSAGSSNGSTGGSGGYDDEAGVEYMSPEIDGTLARITRRKYFFDATQGFSVTTSDAQSDIMPGNCPHAYCMHFVFESDYGAMTPFDAFVLDRYESAGGPVAWENDTWGGGAVPLVLGQFSDQDMAKLGTNWSDVFNWNDKRRTTWTLHPTGPSPPSEIDLTLSLKQLYTLLPGYINSTDPFSNGPFYSADLTDQVIIRVKAQMAGSFTGASALLPLVVNHTGSQLFDVELTSSLVYQGNGVKGGNEIKLAFKLSRRKYGGFMPWFPATPSDECAMCDSLPSEFKQCMDTQLEGQHLVFEDLLSFTNDRTSFDIEPFAENCFTAIAAGNFTNATQPDQPAPPMAYWNGTEWVTDPAPPPPEETVEARSWELLHRVDAGLRCWAESQCGINGVGVKSDAQVVLIHHKPARAHIQFDQEGYSFWLQLGLEDAPNELAITTQVFTNNTSPQELANAIANAFPNAKELNLDIEVVKFDNKDEVAAIERENQWLLDVYNSALQWNSTGSPSTSSSSFSNDGSAAGQGETGQPQPQPPTLRPVPALQFTVEIISHNITVVPHVRSVFFSNANDASNWSEDNQLVFQVAPLNVTKFAYVPPPQHVDLSWQKQPQWMEEAARHLPFFEQNDGCASCLSAYKACLFDADCAFGVNTYFAQALNESRVNKTVIFETTGTSAMYVANLTQTVQSAPAFFPGKGYELLMDMLSCWASRPCNLDSQRTEWNDVHGWVSMPATSLEVTSPTVALLVEMGEVISFEGRFGQLFNYTFNDTQAFSLKEFLLETAWKYESPSLRGVMVDVFPWEAPHQRISLTWPQTGLVHPPRVFTSRASSFVVASPMRMEIHTHREDINASNAHPVDHVLQWPRLTSWLQVFQYVPYGRPSTGGSWPNNGTTGSWNNGTTNSTWPGGVDPFLPPAVTDGSICPACRYALWHCISDFQCLTAVQAWFPGVLASTMYPFQTWEGIEGARARVAGDLFAETLDPVVRERVVEILHCAAKNKCAVDYSSGSPSVPTTLLLMTNHIALMPPGMPLRLRFGPLDSVNYGGNLYAFMDAVTTNFGSAERITINEQWDNDVLMTKFNITSSFRGVYTLEVLDGSTTPVVPGFIGYLHCDARVLPSWDDVPSWFLLPTPSKSDCAQCLHKIHICYRDADCWNSVQSAVVPILRGDNGVSLQKTMTDRYDFGGVYHRKFAADLGTPLRARLLDASPVQPLFQTNPASRQMFVDIVKCLAVNKCDVDLLDSAAEPPATAHVPSYLTFQPAQIQIFMYGDSMLNAHLNGQNFQYVDIDYLPGQDNGARPLQGIQAFFQNMFGTANVPFTVTVTADKTYADGFDYTLQFSELYVGELPTMEVLYHGPAYIINGKWIHATASPWQLTIDALDMWPQHDKLLRLLSVGPTTTTISDFACASADDAKRACLDDYWCRLTLTSTAIPALQTSLMEMAPQYNPTLNQFELDLTTTVAWQMPMYDQRNLTTFRFGNLIRDSRTCGFVNAQLDFQDARVQFTRPANGSLNVVYRGQTYSFHDEDPSNDGVSGFQQFMWETFVQGREDRGASGVMLYNWMKDPEGNIHYDVRFPQLYDTLPPHFFWTDDQSGMRMDSSDTPWSIVIRAPNYGVGDSFLPWAQWLGMDSPVW